MLIHGRLDLSCPAITAWELAGAWPGAKLLIDDHAGHRGSDLKRAWMLETMARFSGMRTACELLLVPVPRDAGLASFPCRLFHLVPVSLPPGLIV